MMRTSAASDPRPITTTGSQTCWAKSMSLLKLHGASMYSAENSPPTLCPNQADMMYMADSAIRKSGTARKKKARKVAV
jgi:hypothetical protein